MVPGSMRHSERDSYYRLPHGTCAQNPFGAAGFNFSAALAFGLAVECEVTLLCREGQEHGECWLREPGRSSRGLRRAFPPGQDCDDSSPKETGGLGPVLRTTYTLKACLRSLTHCCRKVRSPLQILDKTSIGSPKLKFT